MNQLEHLKALRDKARIQTEQAKAVLKQQGEISESLDRLIAALEGNEDLGIGDAVSEADEIAVAAVAAAPAPAPVSSLTEMISNIDGKKNQVEAEQAKAPDPEEVVWVEEEKPELPAATKSVDEKKPPKLEPIVWEVAGQGSVPGVGGDNGADDPEADSTEDSAGEEEEKESNLPGVAAVAAAGAAAAAVVSGKLSGDDDDSDDAVDSLKFKFLKFGDSNEGEATEVAGEEASDDADNDDTIAIDPSMAAAVPNVPVSINEDVADEEEEEDAAEVPEGASEFVDEEKAEAPIPVPPVPVPVPTPEVSGSDEEEDSLTGPEVAVAAGAGIAAAVGAVAVNLNEDESEEIEISDPPAAASPVPSVADDLDGAVVSNIFFDANSAYLKDSELTKIQTIADAVSGSEPRVVKIQGLEDLASSNDFKVLLASRRILAVRKKLSEKGVEEGQLAVNEIQLSEEGRVLDPPSIAISPQQA